MGWQAATVRWGYDESHRLKREMRPIRMWRIIGRLHPAERREAFRRMSSFMLLERD